MVQDTIKGLSVRVNGQKMFGCARKSATGIAVNLLQRTYLPCERTRGIRALQFARVPKKLVAIVAVAWTPTGSGALIYDWEQP